MSAPPVVRRTRRSCGHQGLIGSIVGRERPRRNPRAWSARWCTGTKVVACGEYVCCVPAQRAYAPRRPGHLGRRWAKFGDSSSASAAPASPDVLRNIDSIATSRWIRTGSRRRVDIVAADPSAPVPSLGMARWPAVLIGRIRAREQKFGLSPQLGHNWPRKTRYRPLGRRFRRPRRGRQDQTIKFGDLSCDDGSFRSSPAPADLVHLRTQAVIGEAAQLALREVGRVESVCTNHAQFHVDGEFR